MFERQQLLVHTYCHPEVISDFTLVDWDLLLRQGQRADMLSRLWYVFDTAGLTTQIPPQPLVHLESARILAEGHERAIRWEVNRICHALRSKDLPVILLKGAAYLMADLPMGKGRLFADIDLLIERSRLEEAEGALLINGWISSHLDEYDQRYYRKWMHEIPPLKHMKRQSVLDVHHTILPLTASLKPSAEKLLGAIVTVPDNPEVFTLWPIDMVLHSATHLFHEGEFEHGFRGLTDLDGLLRHFETETDNFWPKLIDRAAELDLKKPLYYALRYTQAILSTPIHADAIANIGEGVPKGLSAQLMDALFLRALQPHHHSCDRFGSGLARWLLFIRSHYLRMPLYQLLPHLFRKALKPKKQL